MLRIALLLILLASSFSASATDCLCKSPEADEFSEQRCPTVTPAPVESAEPIQFWFQSIEAQNLLGLMGDFASVRVCMSKSTTRNVGFKVDPARPWPEVVRAIANKYGWRATINSKEILITN